MASIAPPCTPLHHDANNPGALQVFSSRHDYLAMRMSAANGGLITGLIATFVTAALAGVIILAVHSAWWQAEHRRQLAWIRDRQDMQGGSPTGAPAVPSRMRPSSMALTQH